MVLGCLVVVVVGVVVVVVDAVVFSFSFLPPWCVQATVKLISMNLQVKTIMDHVVYWSGAMAELTLFLFCFFVSPRGVAFVFCVVCRPPLFFKKKTCLKKHKNY